MSAIQSNQLNSFISELKKSDPSNLFIEFLQAELLRFKQEKQEMKLKKSIGKTMKVSAEKKEKNIKNAFQDLANGDVFSATQARSKTSQFLKSL